MINLKHRRKSLKILACTLGLFAIVATGCKKPGVAPKGPTAVTGPYLYVGGASNSTATFWKISLAQPGGNYVIGTATSAKAISSIATSGNDVYMAAGAPGYWKNQIFMPVPAVGASAVYYIAIVGTSVYTAGLDSYINYANLAYWVNNNEVNLQSAIKNQFPNAHITVYSETGMAISGSNVLVTGRIYVQNWSTNPAGSFDNNGLLWTNGNLQVFGPGGIYYPSGFLSTVGITVLGPDSYVAGVMPDSTHASGYWKNGVFNDLNNKYFTPACITSAGNDIYIGGFTYNSAFSPNAQGVYWKSGTFVSIANEKRLITMVIYNNDVYALGIDNNNNNVVWKNGSVFVTVGSASNQLVSSMAIGKI
jgi:hypothetical protein